MIAACERWDDLLNYERPDAWLFKVAIRKLRRAEAGAKERSKRERLANADQQSSVTVEESADTRLYLAAALTALPTRQAKVISLRFLSGYTAAETAQILGLTEAAVSAIQRRGLEVLRQKLGPLHNE